MAAAAEFLLHVLRVARWSPRRQATAAPCAGEVFQSRGGRGQGGGGQGVGGVGVAPPQGPVPTGAAPCVFQGQRERLFQKAGYNLVHVVQVNGLTRHGTDASGSTAAAAAHAAGGVAGDVTGSCVGANCCHGDDCGDDVRGKGDKSLALSVVRFGRIDRFWRKGGDKRKLKIFL